MRRCGSCRSRCESASEAHRRQPDVAAMPCVSVTETAAEKRVALSRRIAMELAGLSRDPDPTLMRHIHDLHLMSRHIDPGQVVIASSTATPIERWYGISTWSACPARRPTWRAIAEADAKEFRHQYPA
jgi:hypothetical protein